MAKEHKRLGDLLVEAKLLTPQDLADAIAQQKKSGELLGATLMRMGLVTEEVLMRQLQLQLGLPLVDLAEMTADEQALALVREDLARKYIALPIELEGRSSLTVAMADPLNVAALEDLRFHSGMFIKPVLASPSQIQEAIERFYHMDRSMNELIQNIISKEDEVAVATVEEEENEQDTGDVLKESEGRPIVRLTNWMLSRAVEERASDVHIEPQDHDLVVRFRVDGLLRVVQKLPKWTQGSIVSRIKSSNPDIAEKRRPGRAAVVEVSGRRDMRFCPPRPARRSSSGSWTGARISPTPGSIEDRASEAISAPQASCWSPGPPARASRPCSTPGCATSSTRPRTSSRSRTRSSCRSAGSTRCRSTRRRRRPSPPPFGRSCARTRTSS
jgi:type IV pilus assembly protein PilB